ncbi:LytR/AlgR family response regulator transcription factor [Dyadobacter sp.]|uniref:LytR/AlgR family response regulator transcription factor n=1 Tax=Dyadobacter sp. TaxID=1914288 RepID=UPI003F711076
MSVAAKILIVEDNPLLSKHLEVDLGGKGFSISGVARNLTEAVFIMKKQSADLALIDMKLDGPEDGIATAQELLRIKWIPIIYITGEDAYEEIAERSQSTYPAAFLEKPVRSNELVVQINLALHNFQAGNLPAAKANQTEHIVFFTDKEHIQVKQNNILFIEADGPYARLYLTTEEFVKLYPGKTYNYIHISPNIGRIFPELKPTFFKLSRKHVINLDHITRMSASQIVMGNHIIPIPEGRRPELIAELNVVRSR